MCHYTAAEPPALVPAQLAPDLRRTAFGQRMDIQQILVLRGPNVWANSPVIEVWVDLRPDLDVPSNTFPGFNERLKQWLPSMVEHHCGVEERGGFFQRLDTGTYLGHILEHTCLELQSLVGPKIGFGRTRESSTTGVYRVAVKYAEERLGVACMQTAIALLTAARTLEPFDVTAELEKLRALAERVCLGPSTQSIVSAARERRIPWVRLSRHSLVQFGYGQAQRRIWTAETDQTSAIAESIAQDKELTRTLLRQSGVPVPAGRVVSSAEEAWQAAQDLGLPVVVKPREGNHGRGVSIDLSEREAILRAFDIANAEQDGVLVEQCIRGLHHRLLVVGNRLVAAAQGEPDYVTGDGQHSLRELVDLGNQQPDRGNQQTHQRDRLVLDAVALDLLCRQGQSVDSIPATGQRVVLHHNGDLPNDVTPLVHPELSRLAVLAAKTIGLNIAGVDMMLTDVSLPPEQQPVAVLEVNASPSLLMHVKPTRGEAQPVGEAILEQLFAVGLSGRIPLVAVSGTNGKSSVIALLEALVTAQTSPPCLGVASSDGLFVGGRALVQGVATDYENVERLLVNPLVAMALIEMEPATILQQGIAFDRCQVAVVTNLGSCDHLGLPLMDRNRMLLVERCGVDIVLDEGTAVLNADDAEVLAMAPKCRGQVLLFSRDAERVELVGHRERGGRTVAVNNAVLRFEAGATCLAEAPLPAGLHGYDVENLLAALGAAWSLGFSPLQLVASLVGVFEPTVPRPFHVSRTRLFEHEGRRVVVTLARNPSAFEAVLHAVEGQGPFARRIAIQTHLPRDWRDEDAFTVGSLLGKQFDEVRLQVETQWAQGNVPSNSSRNGQPEPNLAAVFAEGVRSGKRAVLTIGDGIAEADRSFGLASIARGDLLFVQVGNSQSFASISLPGEGFSFGDCSSAATHAHRHSGSLVEV